LICAPVVEPPALLGLQLYPLDAVSRGDCAPVLLLYRLQGKVISIGRYHLYDGPPSRGGIKAYRRLTGGRIINAGDGWLGCSLIAPSRTGLLPERDAHLRPDQVMNRYARGAIAGIRAVGADCFYPGRDAITCSRREIAICTFEETVTGALLFELFIAIGRGLDSLPSDTDCFDPGGVLTCPLYTGETASTIARELGHEVSLAQTIEHIAEGYAATFAGIQRRDLTGAETAAAHERSTAPGAQWLCDRKPDSALNLVGRASIQLGFMEARLALSGERIERIALSGDFIANSPGLAEFEQRLAGQRLDLMTLTAAAAQTYSDGAKFILGCGDLSNLAALIVKAS